MCVCVCVFPPNQLVRLYFVSFHSCITVYRVVVASWHFSVIFQLTGICFIPFFCHIKCAIINTMHIYWCFLFYVNFSCKGPDSKYFRPCRSHTFLWYILLFLSFTNTLKWKTILNSQTIQKEAGVARRQDRAWAIVYDPCSTMLNTCEIWGNPLGILHFVICLSAQTTWEGKHQVSSPF